MSFTAHSSAVTTTTTAVVTATYNGSSVTATLTLNQFQWAKFRHDNLNTGRGGGQGATGVQKWALNIVGFSWSSSAIGADGTIYVGSGDNGPGRSARLGSSNGNL